MLSTSSSNNSGERTQPLKSYEAIRFTQEPLWLAPDAKRLVWSLDGDMIAAIHVMKDSKSPESLEPYFTKATADDHTGTWHPVSQSPLSEPKISSVTVEVSPLDNWENEWLDWHQGHVELDVGYQDESMVRIGELPDFDPIKDEEGPKHLLRCCGSDRPRGKNATVEVKAGLHSKEDFITIHDYLLTVHPWLLGLKEDILGAISVFEDDPLPPETMLMVALAIPDMLLIQQKAEWMQDWKWPPNAFQEHVVKVD
jgi:hypothetical protein